MLQSPRHWGTAGRVALVRRLYAESVRPTVLNAVPRLRRTAIGMLALTLSGYALLILLGVFPRVAVGVVALAVLGVGPLLYAVGVMGKLQRSLAGASISS